MVEEKERKGLKSGGDSPKNSALRPLKKPQVQGTRATEPFDTALRAYSGQAVDLQEATSERGICVAEYCLVINQWRQLLWQRGDSQRSEVMLWVT